MPDYLVEALFKKLKAGGLKISVAESCTGGLVGARLTSRAGASAFFEYGFVTYSNEAKTRILGVSPQILQMYGAVSSQCAQAMVSGALERSNADIALSITGIAGPDGGSPEKPVGLVYIGCGLKKGTVKIEHILAQGGREDIRSAALEHALDLAVRCLP